MPGQIGPPLEFGQNLAQGDAALLQDNQQMV
jgi:hypothetical protein